MKALKWIISLALAVVVVVGIAVSQVGKDDNTLDTSNLLRIHIRANSNEVVDQNVKYKIKDAFVDFLTPLVCECKTKQEAINYSSKVKVTKEQFPTRVYGEYTVPSGVYDSVIVELGTATGNNWWCVVYPPLCFTNFTNSSNVVYKSKIMEIINKFFK